VANECRKSSIRRLHSPAFHQRFFVGSGLDVGAGEDSLTRYAFMFPRITFVKDWNHSDGDGMDLIGEPVNYYHFVHSSHSLEHMRTPHEALRRWIEVLRPGGHIIVTVPDFEMYEHNRWPSENGEHTHFFTIAGPRPEVARAMTAEMWEKHVSICALARELQGCEVVKIERQEYAFDFGEDPLLDQTCFGHGASESAIEFILRKR
jgi:SAM-dependent methyltransferase